MNWKEFLKRELIALGMAIGLSLFVWTGLWRRGEIFFIPKYFLFIFLLLFVLLSVIVHLTEYQRRRRSELLKKEEEFIEKIIYKSGWGGLWSPMLAIPYYTWNVRKILEEYEISRKHFWRISLTMAAIWWCIIMSGLVIFLGGLAFVLINLKVNFSIAIVLGIIAIILSGFYYSFMLKRFYWGTFEKLLRPYKKKKSE